MNKQELIKEFKKIGIYNLNIFGSEIEGIPTKSAIALIEQLDEPEKVKIPQFVADWYEEHKKEFYLKLHKLAWELVENLNEDCFVPEKALDSDFKRWYHKNETAIQTLVNMHQFGYDVEEEKRYVVKVKGICGNHETLNNEKHSKKWLFSDREENSLYKTKHIRKELEEAGFGWVFDCPGIEIEEVK